MTVLKLGALTAGFIIALAGWAAAASDRRPKASVPAPGCCQRWQTTRQCQERVRVPQHRCLDWHLVPKLRCAKSGRTYRTVCMRRDLQGLCTENAKVIIYRCVRYKRVKRKQCLKWETKSAWYCLKYRPVRRCLQRAPGCRQ